MRVVATAGHVDHGKSTLLRALTGMEPDRWEEERRRGLTIDLGFVWCDLAAEDGATVTAAFVDVPGHERFVANMLAGAGAAPAALFVVAADDGWSAQSQEHLDILDLLEVPAALVAVTKADAAGDERAADVAADVEDRIGRTSLAGAPVVVVDTVSGRGLEPLRRTLAGRLLALPTAPDVGRPRLWVDRAFTVAGAGTVVTGTLVGGGLGTGDDLALLPAGRPVRVRGLQALGRPTQSATPGSRLAVNVAGIDHDEVGRGDVLVTAAEPWRTTRVVDCWMRALPGHEVGRRGAWHIHVGTARRVVDIRPLLGERIVESTPGHVRMILDDPLPLTSGDRFVVRDAGRRETAGGGIVLDPDPPSGQRGPDARLARADDLERVLAADGPDRRLTALVRAAGGAAPTERVRAAAGVRRSASVPGGLTVVGSHLADDATLEELAAAVATAARTAYERDPGGPGAPRDDLLAVAVAAGASPDLAIAVVDHLASAGRIVRRGSSYTLPEHAGAHDDARARREQALLAALDADPFSPPPLNEAAASAGLGHEAVNALVGRGAIVVCGEVAFSGAAVAEAVRRLADLARREGGRFTTAQAREELATTRKYAVPLLERLDALGVTRFDGRTREMRDAGPS